MRITSEMMVANSLRRLETRLQRYETVQSQLASGMRILRPSDDPSGTARALGLRASQRSRMQEVRNAADARSWLGLADSQMQAAVGRLHRARDLTVRAASSLQDSGRAALAQEIAAIRDELTAIANTKHGGRPLLTGYADVEAVARDADGTWHYQGDDGRIERRVGEHDLVQVNVTAREVFGFGLPGGDVFTVLDDLMLALEEGDQDAIAATLGRLDGSLEQMARMQARVGAHTNWVDSALRRTEDSLLAIRTELAEIEDTDIAGAIMELQTQELAYEATLAALARALPVSLVSFLR